MWKLESILDFMKKHPIKAYSYAYSQCQYVWEERSSISCLNEYIHDWWYYHTHKLIGNIQYKILKHKCFKFVRKLTQYNYILIQREDNWSPRFRIVLRRKDEYDYDRCVYEEKLISCFEKRYFNKISIDQYDLSLGKLTKKEKQSDVKLYESFKKILSYYIDRPKKVDELDGEALLSCNCRYILLEI